METERRENDTGKRKRGRETPALWFRHISFPQAAYLRT